MSHYCLCLVAIQGPDIFNVMRIFAGISIVVFPLQIMLHANPFVSHTYVYPLSLQSLDRI